MHLCRHRKLIFFAENTLRPGDGERWPYAKSMRPAALSSELADQVAAGDYVTLINLASFYSTRL